MGVWDGIRRIFASAASSSGAGLRRSQSRIVQGELSRFDREAQLSRRYWLDGHQRQPARRFNESRWLNDSYGETRMVDPNDAREMAEVSRGYYGGGPSDAPSSGNPLASDNPGKQIVADLLRKGRQ